MRTENNKNTSIQNEIFSHFKSVYKKSNDIISNNTNYIKKDSLIKKDKFYLILKINILTLQIK